MPFFHPHPLGLADDRAQIDEMMALIRRCLDLTLAEARANGW